MAQVHIKLVRMSWRPTEPLRHLALPAGALLCALVANALAPAHRKLTWIGWVPPAVPAWEPPVASPPPPPAPALAQTAPLPHPGAPTKPAPPAPKPDPKGPDARFQPLPDAMHREISSEEAWAAFQQKVPFLDARRTEDFAEGHVPGAHSVPLWESALEAHLTEFEARANPAPRDPIVLYCGGGGCEDSHLLAQKLEALGYRNLLIYRDGFPDWAAKGHPQARGARP